MHKFGPYLVDFAHLLNILEHSADFSHSFEDTYISGKCLLKILFDCCKLTELCKPMESPTQNFKHNIENILKNKVVQLQLADEDNGADTPLFGFG